MSIEKMLNIEKIIKKYDMGKILDIEANNDLQFVALRQGYSRIKKKTINSKIIFLISVIQGAIVGYQLSGKGENRWKELSENLVNYINSGGTIDNFGFRENLLKNCKNNCRLCDVKIIRLQKLEEVKNKFADIKTLEYYYDNMFELNGELAQIFNQKLDAKTIVFAVKMFGYASRIVHNRLVFYPSEITIPLDSRLIKLYELIHGKSEKNLKKILQYYMNLSKKYSISPLHLDSLIWVEIWNNYLN